MRTVTFGVANSLDNYIARPDGAVDWLTWSKEVSAITARYWKTIDTVVMGRKTYDVARQHGTSSYPGVKNIVYSRTLNKSPDPNVAVVGGDAVAHLRDLKSREGKGICLLGSGLPLFNEMSRQIDLELADTQVLKNGCVYLLYRVTR